MKLRNTTKMRAKTHLSYIARTSLETIGKICSRFGLNIKKMKYKYCQMVEWASLQSYRFAASGDI